MEPSFFQTLIQDYRPHFEILYFMSGPAIFILAVIGLRQIFIANKALDIANQTLETAKENIIVRSTREALSASVAQCERYVEKILPSINKLNKLIAESQVPGYSGPKDFYVKEEISKIGDEWKNEFINKIDPFYSEYVDVLNLLELYSMTFTKQVADEKAAFPCVGFTFCNSVEDYYPMIAFARDYPEDKTYGCLLELYDIWSKRLKKEKLKIQKMKTENQLSCIPDAGITPVGV